LLTLLGGLGVAAHAVASFSSVVYSSIKTLYPTTTYLSCSDFKKWHYTCGSSSAGYIPAIGKYVTKHTTNWYAAKYYQDFAKTDVRYQIHEIY